MPACKPKVPLGLIKYWAYPGWWAFKYSCCHVQCCPYRQSFRFLYVCQHQFGSFSPQHLSVVSLQPPIFFLECFLRAYKPLFRSQMLTPLSEFLHIWSFLTVPPFCFPLFSFGFKADSWQQHAFGHPLRVPTGQHKSWGSALLSINGLQAQRWRSRVSTAYWARH